MAIFFCFRQVVPSPDNLAANSLASDIQEKDVRKVKISAKVTLAIWVLETISFAVLFVIKHIYQNYELLSAVSILLLHVVIPFIFLANSSENRERLADFRFLNVIQNTIGIHPKNAIRPSPMVPTIAYTVGFKSTTKEMMSEKEVRKWAGRLENPFKGTRFKDPNENDGTVLSDFEEKIPNNVGEIYYGASTSHGYGIDQPKLNMILAKSASLRSDEDNTPNLRQDMHFNIAGEIFEKMVINIDVEYRYIFYLKELLRLEDLAREKYDYNLEIFKINEFDEVYYCTRQKTKNVKGPKNRKKDNSKMVFTEIEDSELNIKFFGNFWQRRGLRKEMLNNFREQLNDNASYKQFLNDFLHLEENFR